MQDYLMGNYARIPIAFSHGEGAWLWDEAGKRYLDALTGIAVCGLGHAHPRITRVICEQAGQLLHTSNIYRITNQELLAEKLCQLSKMDKAFFCNSGAEANEAAIKLARLYGHRKGMSLPKIIVTSTAFHGRTLAALAATGNPKAQEGFEPLVEGFVRTPFGDLEAIQRIAKEDPDIVAVLVEPIQGEGGINIPDDNYLPGIRALCDQQGWLMMLDEVQSGTARTGKWFAHQAFDFIPDVMCLAKGLGNGIPIGACLARGNAADVLTPGTHGSTFGGNPFACAVANEVLEVIADDNLLENAQKMGQYLLDGFNHSLADVVGVVDIRGKGLMIAIALNKACGNLVKIAIDNGLLINVTAGNTIRLLPPLNLKTDQADEIVTTVTRLVRDFLANPGQKL